LLDIFNNEKYLFPPHPCVIAVSRQMAGPRTRRFFIGLAEEEYEKIEK